MNLTPVQQLEELAKNPYDIHLLIKNASGGNYEDMLDTYQEALLAAWSKIDSFNPEKRMRPWLKTIAKRKGIDSFRKRSRKFTYIL